MAIERTFSIIKPNAVAKNVIGSIFARFEAAGFKIVGTKMLHLTVEQARGFYAEHDGKPFFDGLVEFMTSGPIVVSVLESENAVQRHRDLLGATNPANALAGTLRADYADSLTENGTHGSDSLESAQREIAFSSVKAKCVRAPVNLLRLSRCKCVGGKLSVQILFLLMPRADVASLRQNLYNAAPPDEQYAYRGVSFSTLQGP